MKSRKENNKRFGFGAIILALANLFTSSGCDILPIGAVMYGCPNADYDIKGKVVDEKNKGIAGIEVEFGHVQESNENVIYDVECIPFGSVTTEADGSYHYVINDFPHEKVRIKATDVDGEENGGTFATDSITIKVEFKGKDKNNSWYAGKAEATAPDIKLKKATE